MPVKCRKCQAENPDTQKFCGQCATPLPGSGSPDVTKTLETPAKELTRGTLFAGRYEIIEELGRGGMGAVYRAEDTKVEQEIALKLIKPEIASDKTTIQRFQNELKTARQISHRNVCRMYDLGEDGDTRFITMEYVRGEDLKSFIRRSKRLSIATAVDIAAQICEGLAEAHRLGVVHRDLKPGNIMIDGEGEVRILDFGIARSLKEKGLTVTGSMIGTPAYMSPEQAEAGEIDHRADLYSLGVILYEMVTGSVPFEGETALSTAMKHKGESPEDPKHYNLQTPEELSRLILKCLEKKKEDRYQSAEKLQQELRNIEKDISTEGGIADKKEAGPSGRKTGSSRWNKILVPVLGLVVLAAALVAIWKLRPGKESLPIQTGIPRIAVLSFEDLSPNKDQGHQCEAFAERINTALSSIDNLVVLAPDSSYLYKGREVGNIELGKMLSVGYLIRGSLQISGDSLQILTRLIDASDNSVLWTEPFDGKLEDIFDIQDKISLTVVDKLKIKLMGSDEQDIQKRYTEDIEAYSLYAQGLYFWNRRTSETMEKAIEYFRQAVQKDPNYALAYAGLADCYNLLSFYSNKPPMETFPKAREAAQKALSLDEELAEAHNSLAYVKSRFDWDWEGAERAYKRTLELNPNYAIGHQWYAEFLNQQGRTKEAIAEMQKALALSPASLIINTIMGYMYTAIGQPDRAVQILKKTIEMDPNFGHAHAVLGLAYWLLDRIPESLDEVNTAIELSGRMDLYSLYLGVNYVKAGKREEARQIIDSMVEQSESRFVSPFYIASIHVALGEFDKAFEFLDKAYEMRDDTLIMIKKYPWMDSIREDPRYFDLLRKIGME